MLKFWQLLILSAVITPTLSFNIHLCLNDSVNVRPNSSGTIEYRYVQTSGSCTLTLKGFTSPSYVSIPGTAAANPKVAGCLQNAPFITINNKQYCVVGRASTNQVMTYVKDGMLNFTYPSPGLENFTVQLYNNVAVCEQEVMISSGSEVSQLSGILASSYTFINPRYSDCEINLSLESRKPFAAKFKKQRIFEATVKIGDETLDEGTSNEETFVVHSTNGVIGLTAENIDLLSYLFIVKYTVLYCETNPYQIDNGTFSPANGHWLVGSTVTFEYNCLDGFNLIGTTELSVECKEDGGQSMFELRKDFTFKCVPVICDLPFSFVANGNITTTQDKYSYKEELKYGCDDGFSKNGSVVCGDKGVWSGTPGCEIVCTISSELILIINGNITTQDKYSYKEELKYECDDGYSRNESVVCGDGGVWSGIPGCVQEPDDANVCPQPPIAQNANLVTMNSTALYCCNEGFMNAGGDRFLYCRTNGENKEWAGRILVCKRAVLLNVVVGVTVPIGLALLGLSIILTALYSKGYIACDKHQQGIKEREMTDLTEVNENCHSNQAQSFGTQPTFSNDPEYANVPPSTSTADYEVLSGKSDDREYGKLQ